MKQYSTYLFDWDGCLAKTLHLWLQAYQEVCAQENLFPSTSEVVKQAFGNWDMGMKNLGCRDPKTAINKVVNYVNQIMPTVELYPSAKQVISTLKSQAKLALITSSKKDTIMPAVNHHQLQPYFDVILTVDDITKPKPDPEIIHLALKRLSVTHDNCLIIGDSPHDISAGQNASIDTCLFYPQENRIFYQKKYQQSLSPSYTITSLKALLPK